MVALQLQALAALAMSVAAFDHDPLWITPPSDAPAPLSHSPNFRSATAPHPSLNPATSPGSFHLAHNPVVSLQSQPGNVASASKGIKTCKGREDYCENEAECCEIDQCNIWQHIGRDVAVLLAMYAKWCPVSRDFMLQYDFLRKEYDPADRVLVAKADSEENPNLVVDFNVAEFPQIILFQPNCYWTPNGCLDPEQHFVYNGTSNDAEEIRIWVEDTLIYIAASLATKTLPPVAEGPCKVTEVVQPPDDMKQTFKFPRDEGAQLIPRRDGKSAYKMADEPAEANAPAGYGPLVLAPDENQARELVPRPLGDPQPGDAALVKSPDQGSAATTPLRG